MIYLAYFDSGPIQTLIALDRMNKFYEHERCNVNRGDLYVSNCSKRIEVSRKQFADLINAKLYENIMFTAGATHGLNIIAEWHKDVPVVINFTKQNTHANIELVSTRKNNGQW